jgi:hypothetical protein
VCSSPGRSVITQAWLLWHPSGHADVEVLSDAGHVYPAGLDFSGGDPVVAGSEGELVDGVVIGCHHDHRPALLSCFEPRLVGTVKSSITVAGEDPLSVGVLADHRGITRPQASGGFSRHLCSGDR